MGDLISPLILARVDYQEAARHGWGVTELDPYGAAPRRCAAFGSPSSVGWRKPRSRAGPSEAA